MKMYGLALTLAFTAGGVATASGQELLLNADYEITDNADPNFGWQGYGPVGVNDFFGGNGHGSLFTDDVNSAFGGIFQDVSVDLTDAGSSYTFSLNNVRVEGNVVANVEFGIEFRSAADTLISASLMNIPTGAELNGYSDAVTAISPAGTTVVRAIQLFDNGAQAGNGQTGVFIFDTSLTVPEPASLGLLAIGSLLVFGRRRRVA